MFIDAEYTPEIDPKKISQFVFDKMQTELIGLAPSIPGYSISKERYINETPIELWAQVKEYYNVIEKNSIVTSFEVVIPIGLLANIKIYSMLLILDGLADEIGRIIIKVFENYDPNSGVDPNDYIYSELQSHENISSTMFYVRQRYSIKKIELDYKEQRYEVDKILALYKGTDTDSKIDVIGKDTSISGFFKKKGMKVELIRRENLEGFVPIAKAVLHTVDGNDSAKVDQIVIDNAIGFDCGGIIVAKTRIATIFHVPEFKVESGWRKIKVGCFTLTLPWVRVFVRDCLQVLYACVGHNNNLQRHLVQQLISCSTNAALTSAVIGIVTLNPVGALAAFKSLLFACLSAFGESEVACLFPDLVIQSEAQDWILIELKL